MYKEYQLSKKNEYACLIIGDEILDGHVQECNYMYLIQKLAPLGYFLKEVRIVSDQVTQIAEALRELSKSYSFVVSTGGIGPTHDDRTYEAYAKGFELALVEHQEMKAYMFRKPRDSQEKIQAALNMCMMPAEVELIMLDETWPLLKLHNCYIMAGLPIICKITIDKLAKILPPLTQKYYAATYLHIFEHNYMDWLRELAKDYEGTIDLGSYPLDNTAQKFLEGFTTKISLSSTDKIKLEECLNKLLEYLKKNNWDYQLVDLA